MKTTRSPFLPLISHTSGYLCGVLMLLTVLPATAQKRRSTAGNTLREKDNTSAYAALYNRYMDSLRVLRDTYTDWTYTGEDTLSNPAYFYLFLPPTLYADVTGRVLSESTTDAACSDRSRISVEAVSQVDRTRAIDYALMQTYVERPWLIRYHTDVDGTTLRTGRTDIPPTTPLQPKVNFTERVKKNDPTYSLIDDADKDSEWDIAVRRPNFWTFKSTTSFQFTQYYVTDNWYKGGESNNSLLADVRIEANFDNRRKLIFNNCLEMRLGFQTSKGDDKHKIRTNADLLRLTNKLGLQATKHWYYTLTLQSWTQFYPGYKKNDPKVYSDFMSPFECLLTIGMDHKISKKKYNFNLSISPLALDLKYVDRKALATSFGVNEGKHSKLKLGSNLTATYNWNIVKNVTWSGRIYYFTDYDKVQIEWENTFNLQINKFLSTKLFLYPRFDDSVNRKEGDSYFQFHELLSVGLNYSF